MKALDYEKDEGFAFNFVYDAKRRKGKDIILYIY